MSIFYFLYPSNASFTLTDFVYDYDITKMGTNIFFGSIHIKWWQTSKKK